MKKHLKKILSLVLSLALVFSLAAPAFAGTYDEKPTVYVIGARVTNLYNADGTLLFPYDGKDAGEVLKEAIKPCLEKLAVGMLRDDYGPWAQEFHDALISVMGDMSLDANGEASDGSYAEHPYNYSLPRKTSNYGAYDYRLWYDWRLSPLETAGYLRKYIDEVKAATGEDKVNITGRCYGANVVQAYLTLYPEHAIANVDDVAYLSSSVDGIDALGALFSGNIELDDQAIENFVNYYMENEDVIEDGDMKELLLASVELFNYISVLGLTGDVLEAFVQKVKPDIFPLILLDTFAGWPSYWAMLPADEYEEARDFIFAGIEDEYAKFIEKCDTYHYNVQLKTEETLKYLASEGIDFYMVSKYNFPDLPVYEGATALSDGNTTVYRQSFGATCADYGEILSSKYINSLADTKYLSPDHKIDASTCLFPETSYFVKNLHHETFPYAINSLAMNLMNHEATVSGGEYAQYLLYNGTANLGIVDGLDEDGAEKSSPKQMIFIRFFTAILKFFNRILKGEIDFSTMFSF